jgi:hypothetical protein
MRKPKFGNSQKLSRLLDMLYKPSELADELGVTLDTIRRSYIPAGLPVIKDDTGHIWIHGLSFIKWVNSNQNARQKRDKNKCPIDESFCFSCKKRVKFPYLKPAKVMPANRWVEMMQAPCPICGGKVNKLRGIKRG